MKPLTTILSAAVATTAAVTVTIGGASPGAAGLDPDAAPTKAASAAAPAPDIQRPKIPYLRANRVGFGTGDWRLVRPDGTRQLVGTTTWSDFAVLGRGIVASYGTEAGVEVVRVKPNGKTTITKGLEHYGLVLSPDQQTAGYLDNAERFVSVENQGRRLVRLIRMSGARTPGAIVTAKAHTCRDAEVVVNGGCTAFVNRRTDAKAVASHGFSVDVPRLRSVADVDRRGRVVGTIKAEPKCSGMLVNARRIAWRTCDHRLESFSPDGRHVLGTKRNSVDRARSVAIYDTAGVMTASWNWGRALVTDVQWEDDGHLLAVQYLDGAWSMVRLGLDGSSELVVGPLNGVVDYPKLKLPLR
ncbi:hypothetical protein [Nocardioides sp. GXZ039]|uniref:hypothetical protein n=1 Tax=Nocardioides sp. GXZ039 TaxID=3136018 RepID=UPI0030F43B97